MESEPPERPAFTDGYDEDRDENGAPRHGYAQLFDALDGVDLPELSAAVTRHLERDGVNFGGDPFVVDPVPRQPARECSQEHTAEEREHEWEFGAAVSRRVHEPVAQHL